MPTERDHLMRHLTEIVNGAFKPVHTLLGTDKPAHCNTYVYDESHPLSVPAHILGSALISLLMTAGNRYAKQLLPQMREVYTRGVPMLKTEFLVAFHPQEKGPKSGVDIITADPALPLSVQAATEQHIVYAVDTALNLYRRTH